MDRSKPSRQDIFAHQLLEAAADLIDEHLRDTPHVSGPHKSDLFPVALEWLALEDVRDRVKADYSKGASKKAFEKRWNTRNEFLADAVVHAMRRSNANAQAEQAPATVLAQPTPSASIALIADSLLTDFVSKARSYLIPHLGPMLPQHPTLWEVMLKVFRDDLKNWVSAYEFVMNKYGLIFRPEWDAERAAYAIQCTFDGFVLRYRIQRDDYRQAERDGISAFADGLIAFMYGIVDWERTGETCRSAMDQLVTRNKIESTPS